MSAKIKTNPDESLIEIETPEGAIYGPLEMPEDDDGEPAEPIFCVDDEDPNAAYIATVSAYEGLKPNTLYKLVEVETLLETGADLEEADDEEEEEDEEDGGVLVEA